MSTPLVSPKKDQRFEFRTTADDRALFARAADALGAPVSAFANDQLRLAALRVLADRNELLLSPVEAALLDDIMSRPARDLPGLRVLLERPTPFVD